MTIKILKKALEEAINNRLGDYPVYVRFIGDKVENRKEIDFVRIVSFSDEKYGEIILRR